MLFYIAKDSADVIKILGMASLSLIIQVDPKCNHKCSNKRETERDLTTEKQLGDMKMEEGCSHV